MAKASRGDGEWAPEKAKEKRSPREILSVSLPRTASPAAQWFADHPDAAELVREWGRMSRVGETDWSKRRLLRYLHEEHAFPYRTRESLERWLANQEQK